MVKTYEKIRKISTILNLCDEMKLVPGSPHHHHLRLQICLLHMLFKNTHFFPVVRWVGFPVLVLHLRDVWQVQIAIREKKTVKT
jgi:hypothetical protein